MWSLQMLDQCDTTGTIYRFVSGKEYVVGRKDCEIIINNDKSISRKHAVLTVIHSESNVCSRDSPSILQVEDLSKFGTYVNRIQVNKTAILKSGDIVKFGGLNSKSKVKLESFVVATSVLKNNDDKRLIKNCLTKLGGHLVKDWHEENSHLVMSSLVLTIKAVCALLSAKPIVTPAYLEELVKSIENEAEEPKIKNFFPELREASLSGQNIDFGPCEIRSKLFIGKTFLFSTSKQFFKLQMPIKLGGGEAVLISSPPTVSYLTRPGVCVLSPPSDLPNPASVNIWIQPAENSLKKHGRRFIPESEIGLAVVFCSTQKYCNPDFNIENESLSITSDTQNSLNLQSQESLFSSGRKSSELMHDNTKVLETSRSSMQLKNSRKHLRRLSNEDEESHPNKIRRLETCDEEQDLFGEANSSVQVISEETDNKEKETITLNCETLKSNNFIELPLELDIFSSNRNRAPREAPNLESTRIPEDIENDINMDTDQVNEIYDCAIVEIRSLVIPPDKICRRNLPLSSEKNFKKFKKVQPMKTRSKNINKIEMEMYRNPDHDVTIGWTQDYDRLLGTEEKRQTLKWKTIKEFSDQQSAKWVKEKNTFTLPKYGDKHLYCSQI